jgi:hypothetical protein
MPSEVIHTAWAAPPPHIKPVNHYIGQDRPDRLGQQ